MKKMSAFLFFIVIYGMYLEAESFVNNRQSSDIFKERRLEMVENQLRGRGINDPDVLEAFRKVPRHKFVPHEHQSYAYRDHPLPIGFEQTISQPYIVAYMTEALNLAGDEKVFEVGTGSGYQAAILAEIVDSVYTIEVIPELSQKAEKVLNAEGYTNVKVKTGDGYKGWPAYAPYDAIIVTCAPSHIPPDLIEQLREGGHIIIPVGGKRSVQKLVLMEKVAGKMKRKKELPVRFVPMIDSEGQAY
jgi:protein-L-isoaspartate(D-aspartate) O-methyltransferase